MIPPGSAVVLGTAQGPGWSGSLRSEASGPGISGCIGAYDVAPVLKNMIATHTVSRECQSGQNNPEKSSSLHAQPYLSNLDIRIEGPARHVQLNYVVAAQSYTLCLSTNVPRIEVTTMSRGFC